MSRALMAAVALAAATACGRPQPEPPATAAPLGRAAYERQLAAAAGGPVAVERLLRQLAGAARAIEVRMDRLAAGSAEGWRPLFAELRRQGPADGQELLEAYRRELELAAGFVVRHQLMSVPAAQPEVVVLENPALRDHFPFGLYYGGRFAVTTAAGSGEDADYLANHCWVCIPPVAVHEGYPGHHVALARLERTVGATPRPAELARYKPFVEGWGLYAEALMLESGYYGEAERELGAWRMLLLRLLRAEIDGGLHGGGLGPAAAEALYRERLLLSPAAAAAEVRGHLAKPAVKASYAVGLLQILELRERTSGLEARQFHDRLLGPPAPLPRIARERFGVELGPPGEAELPWPWGGAESGG